jgi:exosortase C (VPDSG-CTERM-specific)
MNPSAPHKDQEKVGAVIGAVDRSRRAVPGVWIAIALVVVAFSPILLSLGNFALEHDLYSYVLLVPAVSLYLIHAKLKSVAEIEKGGRGTGIILGLIGCLGLGCYGLALGSGVIIAVQDSLALATISFVALVVGACSLLLDQGRFRQIVFPLAFLGFMVPLPVTAEAALENFLQHGSAPPAAWLFSLAGTPFFKQDMVFQLPGMTLQIAPECSGIRSTLVLFMASILAGHLFLRSPWRQLILVAFVIPLALARNGFRVFTIGELCVHIGPHMIDSDIHHKGGSIFFALSLIPFFGVLYYLVRSERRSKHARVQGGPTNHE